MGDIVNKAGSHETDSEVAALLKQRNLEIIGQIPNDKAIFEAGLTGDPLYPHLTMDYGEQIINRILENE